jgi:hypothetical protein
MAAESDADAQRRQDCLFLSGVRRDAELPALIDQLDLVRGVGSSDSDGAWTLRVGGTAMQLVSGRAARALFDAGDADAPLSIGGAASEAPDPVGLLAIRLVQAEFADQQAHLAAVQQLCVAAVALGSALGATRLFWPPAQLWSPFAALTDAVAALQDQGLPPVLHLVAMRRAGAARMQTGGLAHFCGVELAIDHPAEMTEADAVRRLARLAIHAMIVGPMLPGASVAGLAPGETLVVGRTEAGTPPILPVHARPGRTWH